jgi:hypothetical protein
MTQIAERGAESQVLVMDGSVVGRGCMALMIHGVSTGRALPRAWLVHRGQKGHCPADLPIAVIAQVQDLLPPGAQVVVLGDGACAGPPLQHTVQEYGWAEVVRTGSPSTVRWDGEPCRGETVGACRKPGTLVERRDVHVTAAAIPGGV